MGKFRIIKILAAIWIAASVAWGQTWEIGDPFTGNAGDVVATLSGGTLTVSGTGQMSLTGGTPWAPVRDSITTIVIGNGVTNITERAFSNLTNLTSVSISETVTYIDRDAFAYATNLTSIRIPNSVEVIGNSAFSNASRLSDVTIGNSVRIIGQNAFYLNTALTSITLPNSVTEIGGGAFWGAGLTSINIPNSVTSVGSVAFRGFSATADADLSDLLGGNLETVTIGYSLATIGGEVFAKNPKLTAINVHENNTYFRSIDGILFNKAATTLIQYATGREGHYTIPSTVITIGAGAFENAAITSVTIPNSVTQIQLRAFAESRLTALTIPASVTTIEQFAFWISWITQLTSVTNLATTPQVIFYNQFHSHAFSNMVLYVPPEAVNAYSEDYHWGRFGHILGIGECLHSFGAWTVITAATCETNGLRRRTCTRNGCDFEETTPMLAGPDLANGKWHGWEIDIDTLGSRVSFNVEPENVSFTFNTATSNAGQNRWAWTAIRTEFDSDWEEFSEIDITYSSNEALLLILAMDDPQLSDGGALFRANLAAGQNITRTLSLSDFAQPAWVGNGAFRRPSIDKSLLSGVIIHNVVEGRATTGSINHLSLRGVSVDCNIFDFDCTAHEWSDPAWDTTGVSCTTAGTRSRTRTCSLCGDTDIQNEDVAALGHNWGSWQITPATCFAAGDSTRICQRDSTHIESRAIAQLTQDCPINITSNFTDTNFLAAVYSLIEKTAPAPIFNTDVKDIDTLDLQIINEVRAARNESTIPTIRNLSGIEHFVSLEYLNVSGHDLTELDLSSNVNLIHLDVSGNLISELDLSNNTALKELKVEGNRI
ncbi:MAG: leucine-rich repeat protein, partial [Chitinivibrionia bacterium]|nr:leucine-rich repeat protein [Chitinivibrionia bacterium]